MHTFRPAIQRSHHFGIISPLFDGLKFIVHHLWEIKRVLLSAHSCDYDRIVRLQKWWQISLGIILVLSVFGRFVLLTSRLVFQF